MRRSSARFHEEVRWAVLVRETPRLSREGTGAVYRRLLDDWNSQRSRVLDFIATEVGVSADRLTVQQGSPVLRRDGKTRVVDFPRVSLAQPESKAFDSRICIALCTDHMSSKVWARASRPLNANWSGTPANLKKSILRYRQLANALSRWALLRYLKSLQDLGIRGRVLTSLEVSVLGSDDRELGDALDRASALADGGKDQLTASERRAIARHFGPLAGGITHAEGLLKTRRARWLASQTMVAQNNGELEERESCFVLRAVEDRAQAIGVTFDLDSPGEAAHQSSLKVGRWLANRT